MERVEVWLVAQQPIIPCIEKTIFKLLSFILSKILLKTFEEHWAYHVLFIVVLLFVETQMVESQFVESKMSNAQFVESQFVKPKFSHFIWHQLVVDYKIEY